MMRKIKIVLSLIAVCIGFVLLAPKLIFQRHWVGDYQVLIDKNLKTLSIYGYRGDEEVVIPTEIGLFEVKYIYNDAFKDNLDITSVLIPKEYSAYLDFSGCINLKKIEFEEGTMVAKVCVSECESLEEVVIPEGVEIISGWFINCPGLGDIKFPSTLKKARKHDFDNSNLYEIHKNEKYYVVGDGVLLFFNGDYNQDIVIPKGVKSFDDYIPKDEVDPRKVFIPDTISILRTQISDGDTFYFGDGEFESLDLDCLEHGVNGTIIAPADSYVEEYCKENGYTFRVMTDEEEKEWREKTEAAASEITYQE